MPYENTRLLKEDVLFRGGESITGSAYNDQVINYLNRVYFSLASGASEFVPEYVDDWWWLRAEGNLLLEPRRNVGTVEVTENSTDIILSDPPATSVEGWKFRVDGHPDVFTIASHTAGMNDAVLDLAYTGPTALAATYKLMKTTYTLSSNVAALIGPMNSFRIPYTIQGVTPEMLDELYPLRELQEGSPEAFALLDEQTVRFSHGGRIDGVKMRVQYKYRPIVSALTDDTASVPLVPARWRHLLADMALVLLFIDKNDERSSAVSLAARSGVAGMIKENRRQFLKIDRSLGHIYPRSGGIRRRMEPNAIFLG